MPWTPRVYFATKNPKNQHPKRRRWQNRPQVSTIPPPPPGPGVLGPISVGGSQPLQLLEPLFSLGAYVREPNLLVEPGNALDRLIHNAGQGKSHMPQTWATHAFSDAFGWRWPDNREPNPPPPPRQNPPRQKKRKRQRKQHNHNTLSACGYWKILNGMLANPAFASQGRSGDSSNRTVSARLEFLGASGVSFCG